MNAAPNFFFRLILVVVFLFGSAIAAADRDPPRKVPITLKKEIPKITWKNISPPFKKYEYFRDHAEYGFEPDAISFNLINAWWLAEASTLAYADEDFAIPRFGKAGLPQVRFFDKLSTQCYVANNDRFAIVAFRGSEIWKKEGKFNLQKAFADFKADVDIRLTEWPGGGKVHRGFKDALDEVWFDLLTYIIHLDGKGCKIWMTGHSLGAALATLAADRYRNVQGVYTFGSPRVGDDDFKIYYEVGAFRIINNTDIATRVPPPGKYKHVGTIKFIDGDGNIHDHVIEEESFAEQPRDELYGQENSRKPSKRYTSSLIPDSFIDHVPLIYTIHLWNNIIENNI